MVKRSLIIDQASYVCGYAIVEDDPSCYVSYGITGRLIQHGVIRLRKSASLFHRLDILEADIKALHKRYKFDEIVMEDTLHFVERSVQAKVAMGAVYQKIIEIAQKLGLPKPYTQNPKSIKKDVTGNGDATKDDVKEAVARMWGMNRWQLIDDNHADALAGALRWLVLGDQIREKRKEKKRKR